MALTPESPASDARQAEAVHIASAVQVPAIGGELELLRAHCDGIVVRAGVEATESPDSALRYVTILNSGSVSLAAIQDAGAGEEQLSLAPGVTTILLGSAQDRASSAVQVQVGPIGAGVLSLFISAESAPDPGSEVLFLGQAITYERV